MRPHLGLEPLHGVLLAQAVGATDPGSPTPAARDVEPGATEDDVEVQTVDTDRRVVLDTQVDVFLDAEAEVARVAEVLAAQLVFLDLGREPEKNHYLLMLDMGTHERSICNASPWRKKLSSDSK